MDRGPDVDLTIGIPTFSREASLNDLLDQVLIYSGPFSKRIELLVINNGDEFDSSTIFARLRSCGFDVNLIQNYRNCGGQENCIRVYENARGRYVWFLGDDDRIFPNTFDIIFAAIEDYNADVIHFDAVAPDHYPLELQNGALTRETYFGGAIPLRKLMFAPLNVIRTSAVYEALPVVRLFLSSFSPQLNLILLGKCEEFVYSGQTIVHTDGVDLPRSARLSLLPVFLGLFGIADAARPGRERRALRKLIRSEWREFTNPLRVCFALAIDRLQGNSINFKKYAIAAFKIYPFFVFVFFFLFCFFISFIPTAFLRFAVSEAAARTGRSDLTVSEYFSKERV
jgi:glycosyltransferase involved in cell wall biosynthesis